jgi:hypothetical protein
LDSKGDFSSFIRWDNGPILNGIEGHGSPVVIDRIGDAKAQVLHFFA